MDCESSPTERDVLSATEWWESMESLWLDESIGPAVKWAYAWLWMKAGGRPGHIVVRAKAMAAAFGADPRTARGWLGALADVGLVDRVDRDKRGMVDLYVYHPKTGAATRKAARDPQKRLEFVEDAPPASGPTAELKEGSCAQKSPGEFAGSCAQKSPRPPAESAQNPEETALDEKSAGSCAQKSPRHEICSIDYFDKNNSLTQPQPQEATPTQLQLQEGHVCGAQARSLENHPLLTRLAGEGQPTETPRASRREQSQAEPTHVLGAMAEALAAKTDPAEIARLRSELIQRQARRVNDPDTHPSLFARVADAVIDGRLTLQTVNDALDAVDFKRQEAARTGQPLEKPGAYYNSIITAVCARGGTSLTEPAAKADTKTT